MSDGSLHALGVMLTRAMAPLDEVFRDADSFLAFMHGLGWNAQSLPPSYLDVADKALASVEALEALPDEPGPSDIVRLIGKAGDVYRAVRGLTEAPAGVDPAELAQEFARRLFEYLLIEDVRLYAPRWFAALQSLGIIWFEHVAPTATRPRFTRRHLEWDQIPAILGDPASIPGRLYGWGTPNFDFDSVARLLNELTNAIGVPTTLDRLGTELTGTLQGVPGGGTVKRARALTHALFDTVVGDHVEIVGMRLAELPGDGTALPGMIAQMLVPNGLAEAVDLGGGWTFTLRAGTDLAQQLAVVIHPEGTSVRYPFAPGQTLPSAGFGITLGYQGPQPTLLFGQSGHTRLELASAAVGIEVDIHAGDLEVKGSAGTKALALVLNPGDLDGFLGSLFGSGSGETRIEVPLAVSWSSRTGLDFMAGAGFGATLYPHLDLGVVRFDRVDLALRFVAGAGTTPELDVRAAVAFSGGVGPVAFSVDRFGVELAATFTDGNAGPFDLALRPLWPTGLGLSVNAGPVSGGGFISLDPDKGRYVGVLHLGIFDITVTAIGILDTKDTSGNALPSPGFSFLIVISVELPPIQLGLGFTLNGVGGLAALHRRLDAPALLGAVRQGGLDSVLFDKDPIKDAPKIIANLSSIFPVAIGRYVFGPMALIGWGTPTLIRIELAIVVEVPAPVTLALLGQASVVLPDDSAPPIVSLHVDVAGVYDSGKQTLAVDAGLRDSRVANFTIAGDLALRAAFGAEHTFALAVGGLNPHFTAPSGFPTLRRVSVALGQQDNPRISIEGYLAITSNSRQFGAKAELYAAAGGFNVHGWLAFDALFVPHPFSFEFDFSVGMTLNHGSSRIAGVTVDGTLTGPNPFHVKGEASLSLLFFDVSVPFDRTFGDRQPLPELPPADPWSLLRDAIALPENWTGDVTRSASVSLTKATGAPDLVLLHPGGTASLRQRVLPFNRTLDHFGQFSIVGSLRFDVASVLVDGHPVPTTPVTDHFAPGDFENLSQSDQLSRDSFEEMDAGVRLVAPTVAAPTVKAAKVEYETKLIDTKWRSRTLPRFPVLRDIQLAVSGTTVAPTGRARFARSQPRPPAVVLAPERYGVATTDTLALRDDIAAGMTKGAAIVALRHAVGAGGLQVIPEFEARVPS